MNGGTTLCLSIWLGAGIGRHYEKAGGSAVKKSFSPTARLGARGQRVVMKKGSTPYNLFGDHLGTTSVVLDASGSKVAEARHREAPRSAA